MSNSLNDRIKNDYSTTYNLIVREENFYPKVSDIDPKEVTNKINGSAAPGIDNTGFPQSSVDPFRQSTGKFWSFKDGNIKYYDSLANVSAKNIPASYISSVGVSNIIKFEDVSSQWSEIFDSGYINNLNLYRSATRVKVFFKNDDLLSNRLGMLSLMTDMRVKNNTPSYVVAEDTTSPTEITFPKSSAGENYIYNYKSSFDKGDIYISFLGQSLEQAEGSNPTGAKVAVIEEAKSVWSNYSLEAFNIAAQNGHLDYFYDFEKETYKYPIRVYSDMAFGMNIPISTKASSLTNTVNKSSLISDIKSSYNYYSKLYETATKKDSNGKMFVTLPDSGNETVEFTERTLPLIYEVPIDTDETPAPLGEDSKFKFESFGHKLLNCGYIPDQVKDETKAFNIVLFQDDQEYLSKYESIKRQFPFYVNFNFSTDSRRSFTQILNDSGFMNDILDTLIGNVFTRDVSADGLNVEPNKNSTISDQTKRYWNPFDVNPTYSDTDSFAQSARICQDLIYTINDYRDFYQIIPLADSIDKDQLGTEFIKQSPVGQLREIDLNRWLDFYISNISSWSGVNNENVSDYLKKFKLDVVRSYEATKNSKKFGGGASNLVDCPDQETTSLVKLLKTIKFMGKYRELVKENSRTYEQILNKDPAYTETLFYRIQKVALDKDGNPQGNGIIQNIWLPKPTKIEDGKDVMKYIDTQVVYDQNYEYTIYAYNLTIGSKYGFQIATHAPGFNSEKQGKYSGYIEASAFNEGYGKTDDLVYYKPSAILETNIPYPVYASVLKDLENLYNALRPKEYSYKVDEILINNPEIIQYLTTDTISAIKSKQAQTKQEIDGLYSQIQSTLDKVLTDNKAKYIEISELYKQSNKKNTDQAVWILATNLAAMDLPYNMLVKKQLPDVENKIVELEKESQSILAEIPNKIKELEDQSEATNIKDFLQEGNQLWSGGYFYKSLSEDGKRMAMFDVVLEPDVKIVEVPFYKKTTIINDAPSLAPEVDILPLKGKNNDIKINFYPPSVDRELEPIYIDYVEDGPKFNKIRAAQDRSLLKASISFAEALILPMLPPSYFLEPKLQFKSDDYSTQYEVYRMDIPPSQYTDFADAEKTVIDATKIHSFTDKVEQNKKYYYMFRSIDVHGNPSNPSPIYQVEMVENSGVVYPIISIYEFQTPSPGLKSKSFRRYLKIDAETLQGTLNLEKSKLKDSDTAYAQVNQKPILGIKEKGIFTENGSKKYKFRIKSKHTGKILDLNIAFISRHEQPTEEILSCGDSKGSPPSTVNPEVLESKKDDKNTVGSTFQGPFDGF